MNPDEINVFERVWGMIWEFLYKVIAWLSGKKIEKDGTTITLPDMENIKPVY